MKEKKIKKSSNVTRLRSWLNNVTVDFKGGSVYTYFEVDKSHIDGLFNAESVGSYLHKYIKPNYEVKKETEKSIEHINEIIKKMEK